MSHGERAAGTVGFLAWGVALFFFSLPFWGGSVCGEAGCQLVASLPSACLPAVLDLVQHLCLGLVLSL